MMWDWRIHSVLLCNTEVRPDFNKNGLRKMHLILMKNINAFSPNAADAEERESLL